MGVFAAIDGGGTWKAATPRSSQQTTSPRAVSPPSIPSRGRTNFRGRISRPIRNDHRHVPTQFQMTISTSGRSPSPLSEALVEGVASRRNMRRSLPRSADTLFAREAKSFHQINIAVAQPKLIAGCRRLKRFHSHGLNVWEFAAVASVPCVIAGSAAGASTSHATAALMNSRGFMMMRPLEASAECLRLCD